jgi:tRNA-uridine 2-sulfurtransferase
MKKTVVVGMSGGVDSSVSALLLKQQGWDVIGLFMKNWEEQDPTGGCLSAYEYEDVVKVCQQIDIPCYSVNFVQQYWDQVFAHFLKQLEQGYTPNPDVLCNREIKFKLLLEKAKSLGADFLATGHYAQVVNHQLLKGEDPDKDQSYFLYTLRSQILGSVLFPVGSMLKKQVRQIAKQHQLVTHDKKDSTGICFIGERKFKQFLKTYIPYQPGNFENLKGDVVGKHDGVAYYTIGQRKGLGVGGPGEAWFVVGKDTARNVVVIEQGPSHPALFTSNLTASEVHWVAGHPPPFPLHCKAKIRYRQADQDCTVTSIDGNKVAVSFPEPQRAVTPRQSIVFYEDRICLGGGIID